MLIEFDETRADGDDAIACLQELDRIEARVHALRTQLLVKVADPRPRIDEFWVLTPGSDEEKRLRIADIVREELACALRRSPAHMQALIDTARLLAGPLAATRDALHDGVIRMDHVNVITGAAHRLPGWQMRDAGETAEFTAACEQLQRRVLPVAARASMVIVRACARRAALAIDAEGEARRRREAKCTRDVWISGDVDGMSLLIARMTTEHAHALKTQIDAAGFDRAYSVDARPGLTIGEHRIEALAAMILGGEGADGGSAPVTAHINVTIPLPMLLGLQVDLVDGQADLAGEGPVPGTVIRELLQDPACAVTMRRLVTDPITGHLLDYGRKTYDVPSRLRDYIIARDRTCRFPGCNRRADLSQIDHAIPYGDGGETNPANLGALCTRHHQLKTLAGWDITKTRPDGTCRWRSPNGRTFEGGPEPPDPDSPPTVLARLQSR